MPPKKRKSANKRTTNKKAPKRQRTQQDEKKHETIIVPVRTLDRKKCLRDGELGAFLGSGVFGVIYEYCESKSIKPCKFVLKVQRLYKDLPEGHVTDTIYAFGGFAVYSNETFFHSFVQGNSPIPIAPKLYDFWTCSGDPGLVKVDLTIPNNIGIGCMIMDRWDTSLHNIYKQLSAQELDVIEQQFRQWIPVLVNFRIWHDDIHARNILVRNRGSSIKVSLTDWSHATIVGSTRLQHLQKDYEIALIGMIRRR